MELPLAAEAAIWVNVAVIFSNGLLTSISPCPLATNIAAVSYVGRKVDRPSQVLLAGMLYALGRTIVYVGLTVLIVWTTLSLSAVSAFLEQWLPLAMGPVLVGMGMLLTGLITIQTRGAGVSESLQQRIDRLGVLGALLLGFLFALSFCPVSAALFALTVERAISSGSSLLVPTAYGVGTAIPVIAFAVLLAFSAQSIGRAFNMLSQVEKWARLFAGTALIFLGLLFCLHYHYGLPVLQWIRDITPSILS